MVAHPVAMNAEFEREGETELNKIVGEVEKTTTIYRPPTITRKHVTIGSLRKIPIIVFNKRSGDAIAFYVAVKINVTVSSVGTHIAHLES